MSTSETLPRAGYDCQSVIAYAVRTLTVPQSSSISVLWLGPEQEDSGWTVPEMGSGDRQRLRLRHE